MNFSENNEQEDRVIKDVNSLCDGQINIGLESALERCLSCATFAVEDSWDFRKNPPEWLTQISRKRAVDDEWEVLREKNCSRSLWSPNLFF